jgi:hypothetical protein
MVNNKLIVICLLIGGIFCTGCDYPVAKPDGSVPDQIQIANIDYENYWEYLIAEDGTKFSEGRINITQRVETPFIKSCGGMRPEGFVLLNEDDQTVVATNNELITLLGQIKSPEEAIAWLYATNCNLKKQFGDRQQFVNLAEGGYLVGTIFYNWYGCGNHANRLNLYLVNYDGAVRLINSDQLEFGEEFCGD